ncbi:Putative transmembrane protein [Streptococcus thermophilus]|nr:Putative transmembrane protein [Streptococcus thermophilus]CAD0151002.1 Putative transmembrane protein [Streptococcus thermophilus]
MIDAYNNNITIFLTIVTLIFGPDLTSELGMLSLTYLLNIALIEIGLNSKLEKISQKLKKYLRTF